MKRIFQTAFLATLAFTQAAAAGDIEISLYGGAQEAAHSYISGTDPGGAGVFDLVAGWEGRSFSMPPYWGARATWWMSDTIGFGFDFTHAKVYANDATLTATGFDRLEFTDGLNILTLNAYRAWPLAGKAFTPYVGAGLGISVPHVDISSAGGTTLGYQLTGPAATWVAGVSYEINDQWSVFGEYKGSYSMNEVTLGSGGTLSTNIITSAIDIGVSYSF